MKHLSIAIAIVTAQVCSAQTFTAYGPAKPIPYAQRLKN
jgi:hypothetical protein